MSSAGDGTTASSVSGDSGSGGSTNANPSQAELHKLLQTRDTLRDIMSNEKDGFDDSGLQAELKQVEDKIRELSGTASPGGPLVAGTKTPEVRKQEDTVNSNGNVANKNGQAAQDEDDDDDDLCISEVRTVSKPPEQAMVVRQETPVKRSHGSLFNNNDKKGSHSGNGVVDLTEDEDIMVLGTKENTTKRQRTENETRKNTKDTSNSTPLFSDRTAQILNLFRSQILPTLSAPQGYAASKAINHLQLKFTTALKKRLSLEQTRHSQQKRIVNAEQKARGEPATSQNHMILHSLAKSMELTTRELNQVLEDVKKYERQIEIFFTPQWPQPRDYPSMFDNLLKGYYDHKEVLYGFSQNQDQQRQLEQLRMHQGLQQAQSSSQAAIEPLRRPQPQQAQQQLQHQPLIRHHQNNIGSVSRNPLDQLPYFTNRESDFEEDGFSVYDQFSTGSASYEVDLRELLNNIPWDANLNTEDRTGTPEQLKINLLEHQKVGLTWLQKQETKLSGGILADDMGLGKTIQMLALMVSRPAEGSEVKTNLIVAPVALLRQWEREIKVRLKKEHQLNVYVHHSSSKTMHRTWANFQKFDVVITTYGLLSREYKENFAMGIETQDPSSADDTSSSSKKADKYKKSPFYQGNWHRIILDEAQFIKNKSTLSAKACSALDSKFRWCLSGTPMQNKVEELYSLIRFLRIKPYNDEKKFSQDIGSGIKKGAESSISKLKFLLRAILLRRTKNTEIDGKPILSLPPRIVELKSNVFGRDESDYYKALETNTKAEMNKYLKSNSINKNYSSILVLLLRLRQACCHPKLIELSQLKQRERQAKEASPNALKAARLLENEVVYRIKQQQSFVCPICNDGFESQGVLLTLCGHIICAECSPGFFSENRRKLMEQGEDGKTNNANCPMCRSEIFEDQLVDYETFDLVHNKHLLDSEIQSMRRRERKEQNDEKKRLQEAIKTRREAMADKEFIQSDVLGVLFSDSDDEYKDSGDEKEEFGAGVNWDDDKLIVQQLGLENLFPDGWVSATKIDKCMELVNDIKAEYPGEKIIIFSQFTSLLDLLNVPLVRDGFDYLRYDGSMTATERNETVLQFFDDPDKLLMLVSLKAGNVGLTLTCASHVIIMDPFWNPYVEEQAIDRAHRIGQERPVYVHRLVIENSVEDRILNLQDEKRKMIDAALDEGSLQGGTRLDQNQLLYLFGLRPRPNDS